MRDALRLELSRPRWAPLALALAGCTGGADPLPSPPADVRVSATLWVTPSAVEPGSYGAWFGFGDGVVVEQSPWDDCVWTPASELSWELAGGEPSALPDGGDAWLVADGDTVDLPPLPDTATGFSSGTGTTLPLGVGSRVGAGWSGGDDVPAYDGGQQVAILPPFVAIAAPVEGTAIDTASDLELRWQPAWGGQVEATFLTLADGLVRCGLEDDGHYRVSHELLGRLSGVGMFGFGRVDEVWASLADGSYAEFHYGDVRAEQVDFSRVSAP